MSKIVLSLDENNRITCPSETLPDGNYEGMPIVDTLPDGDFRDYLYVSGEYVYDPIPKEEPSNVPVAPRNVVVDEYITVNGVMYKALSNIPNGEPIITGQNAIETTVEEQLAELAKGE